MYRRELANRKLSQLNVACAISASKNVVISKVKLKGERGMVSFIYQSLDSFVTSEEVRLYHQHGKRMMLVSSKVYVGILDHSTIWYRQSL